jgi:hypothetical protein
MILDMQQLCCIHYILLYQVMVFVHARKDTVRTAQALLELATKEGCMDVSSYMLLLLAPLLPLVLFDVTAIVTSVASARGVGMYWHK